MSDGNLPSTTKAAESAEGNLPSTRKAAGNLPSTSKAGSTATKKKVVTGRVSKMVPQYGPEWVEHATSGGDLFASELYY